MNYGLACTSVVSFVLMIIFGVISIGSYYGGVIHDGIINQELYSVQALIISERDVYDPVTYCCESGSGSNSGCLMYCTRNE